MSGSKGSARARRTTSFEAARNQAPELASVPFCLYARKWLPPICLAYRQSRAPLKIGGGRGRTGDGLEAAADPGEGPHGFSHDKKLSFPPFPIAEIGDLRVSEMQVGAFVPEACKSEEHQTWTVGCMLELSTGRTDRVIASRRSSPVLSERLRSIVPR